MNINLIAAIGKNYELGKDNNLVWRLKEDLKFFKNTTMGHPIVMGRKTFESLPKVLPGRKNIVISTSDIRNEEIELYKSIKEFLIKYKEFKEDVFIIGGASIYKQFIDYSNKMYLTEIDSVDYDADAYFPWFEISEWNKENILEPVVYKDILYERNKYVRKRVKNER